MCSGAPNRTNYHAVYVCDMAVDMIAACEEIRDPVSGGGIKLKIGKGGLGLILGLRPANERRCYKVTPSLIGWAQSYLRISPGIDAWFRWHYSGITGVP